MPFQKGNRANPGGRPQRKDWADMLRIVGNEKTPEGKRKLRLLATDQGGEIIDLTPLPAEPVK
jgi:hypothetical protein